MKKRGIWRPLNTYGLLFIGFCCGFALASAVAVL
jgi:hypothetical protein